MGVGGGGVRVTIQENLGEVGLWKREYDRLAKNKELLLYEGDGLKKDDEILRLRGIVEEYKRSKRGPPNIFKHNGEGAFYPKAKTLIAALNARFTRESVRSQFLLWKFKFLFKRSLKLKAHQMTLGYSEPTEFSKTQSRLNPTPNSGLSEIWNLWELFVKMFAGNIFTLFLKSSNEANESNSQSFLVMKINLKELLSAGLEMWFLLSCIYKRLYQSVKHKLEPKFKRVTN